MEEFHCPRALWLCCGDRATRHISIEPSHPPPSHAPPGALPGQRVPPPRRAAVRRLVQDQERQELRGVPLPRLGIQRRGWVPKAGEAP